MNLPRHPLATLLPGPVVALMGVGLVRKLAPCLAARPQAIVLVIGYLLVPLGLFWFASQISRRAAQRAAAGPAPDSGPPSPPA